MRDPVLARTWCALTIRIQGEPVTRVFDRRTKGWRNSVHGSVFPLCNWIVDNLWFLLYEPYRWAVPCGSRDLARNNVDRPWVHRHSLLAAREGGALPDLTVFRDGDAVLLRWLKDGGDASRPFLRFVQEGQAHLAPETVRAGIEKFVDTVLQRASDLPHAEVVQLHDDWADLRRLTPDESNLCAWSARLGINAHYDDELPDCEVERLKSAIGRLEGRIADDLLDASAIGTIDSDVNWIDDAHRRARKARRTSLENALLGQSSQDRLKRYEWTAYAAGYGQARALRERSGLGTDRVPDLEEPHVAPRLGGRAHCSPRIRPPRLACTRGRRLRSRPRPGRCSVSAGNSRRSGAFPPREIPVSPRLVPPSPSGDWSPPPILGTSVPRVPSLRNCSPPPTRSGNASAARWSPPGK